MIVLCVCEITVFVQVYCICMCVYVLCWQYMSSCVFESCVVFTMLCCVMCVLILRKKTLKIHNSRTKNKRIFDIGIKHCVIIIFIQTSRVFKFNNCLCDSDHAATINSFKIFTAHPLFLSFFFYINILLLSILFCERENCSQTKHAIRTLLLS